MLEGIYEFILKSCERMAVQCISNSEHGAVFLKCEKPKRFSTYICKGLLDDLAQWGIAIADKTTFLNCKPKEGYKPVKLNRCVTGGHKADSYHSNDGRTYVICRKLISTVLMLRKTGLKDGGLHIGCEITPLAKDCTEL